ncbi:AVID protein, partial [Podargus strigoides]|nr:AVID protein [Podargus strigoides]
RVSGGAWLLGYPLLPLNLSLLPQCILTGKWKNDLDSNMTIRNVTDKGEFSGIYYTAVTAGGSSPKESPLVGYQHLSEEPTFGFTVNWTFSDSITVFTGQCFIDEGKEVLKTMWLLRAHADNITSDWKATLVGINVFTRLPSQK